MLQINESTNTENQPLSPFGITDAAAARIAFLLSDETEGTYFWVSVLGGGCSGFQYHFDLLAKAPAANDFVIDRNGALLAVDEVAIPLLAGSVLDYVEDLSGAGFEVKNPNATAKCGCGNSFSVKI